MTNLGERAMDLEISREIPAPRQAVFEAWLSREALGKFMMPKPGATVTRVHVDPREGGTFEIVMRVGDAEHPIRGKYEKIAKYSELRFTWVSDAAGADSLVTVLFEELAEGMTLLTLHHVGLPTEEARTNHEGGWGLIVETLAAILP